MLGFRLRFNDNSEAAYFSGPPCEQRASDTVVITVMMAIGCGRDRYLRLNRKSQLFHPHSSEASAETGSERRKDQFSGQTSSSPRAFTGRVTRSLGARQLTAAATGNKACCDMSDNVVDGEQSTVVPLLPFSCVLYFRQAT